MPVVKSKKISARRGDYKRREERLKDWKNSTRAAWSVRKSELRTGVVVTVVTEADGSEDWGAGVGVGGSGGGGGGTTGYN